MPHVLNVAQFVNADEIARGLSPFNPESVAIEAGRIMLNRIDELLDQNKSLTIETTLATRSYARLIQKAHQKGYNVILLYFWLNSPELAIERVATRVRNGGHNIPADIIKRRYNKSICNLFRIFLPICDVWNIYDNSDNPRKAIASGVGKDILKITDIDIFNQLKNYAR